MSSMFVLRAGKCCDNAGTSDCEHKDDRSHNRSGERSHKSHKSADKQANNDSNKATREVKLGRGVGIWSAV